MSSTTDEQIHRLRHACGCTAGTVVMLPTIAGYVVHQVQTSSSSGALAQVLTGAGVGLAGAVVGKLGGLLWARARLVRLLRDAGRGSSA